MHLNKHTHVKSDAEMRDKLLFLHALYHFRGGVQPRLPGAKGEVIISERHHREARTVLELTESHKLGSPLRDQMH